MLTEDELIRFNNALPQLEADLEPKDVTTFLLSKAAISKDDEEEILSGPTRRAKAKALLDILRRKLASLQHLIDALKRAKYHSLVEKLEQKPSENVPDTQRIDSKTLHELTTRGKIPKKPEAYVERTEILNKLKEILHQLSNEHNGWLIIHGMSGCGKTVLAADCVRDPSIIGAIFPNIYWLKLSVTPRKTNEIRLENDLSNEFGSEDEILRSALNFLNQKTKCDPNFKRIDDGFARLEEIFLHNFPKTLIVLDDVSSLEHVKRFNDLNCRFLVTTQNEAICSQITGPKHVFPVEPVGFTKQETFEAFAKWLRTTPDRLPRQDVMNIFDECKGHTFVISLIGSLLRQHNNRWKLYYQYLRRRRLKKLELKNSHANYPYNSFADAAAVSLENLSIDLKEFYLNLSIFPIGVRFSARVLSIFCNDDVTEIEDLMDKLIERQLLTKFNDDPNSDYDSYSIHDLLHNYIKTEINGETKKFLHRRLIENYRKSINDRWHELPNDDYIHWFIGYHAYRCDWHDIFPAIYLNLRFLREKLLACGPADVLGDFVRYADYICENNEEKFKEFRHFLCRNSHFFVSHSNDIVQLALLEPDQSIVHRSALEIVTENQSIDKFYVVSLLENSVEERKRCLLTCKFHRGSVTKALWLPKSDGFVSCSVDKTLKVCSSRSGCEFQNLDLPRSAVCFSLSPDGDKALVACESLILLYDLSSSLNLHEGVNSLLAPGMVTASDSQDRTPSPLINQPTWGRQESCQSIDDQLIDEEMDLIDSPGDALAKLTTNNESAGEEFLWCEISHDSSKYAACGADKKISIWGSISRQLMDVYEGHTSNVVCCKFTDDDSTLASCSDDGTVKIWDLMRRHVVLTFTDHSAPVRCLCFVPRKQLIASAAQSTILVWNFAQGDSRPPSVRFEGRSDVLCVDSSPCGVYLAAGLRNSSILCWHIDSAMCLFIVNGHSGWINSICFSPDSTKLLSASDDGTIAIWNAVNGVSIENIRFSQIYTICLNENGHFLIGADLENRLITIGLPIKNLIAQSCQQNSQINCLSLPPNGVGPLIVGFKNGSVAKFDPFSTDFDLLELLPGHTTETTCVCHSDDGNFFACGSQKGNINVWQIDEKRPIILKGHTMKIVKLKFLKENRRKLISGSFDAGVGVWDFTGDGNLHKFKRLHDDSVLDIDVSNDETLVCSASADKTIKVWNWHADEIIFVFDAENCARCCRFSPSDCFIVGGADDGTIKIWSAKTGALVRRFKGHNTWINDAQFSSDDNLLVTVSNCIKFWSVDKNSCMQTYPLPGNIVKKIFVTNNFQIFLTVDVFGNVHMIKRLGLDE